MKKVVLSTALIVLFAVYATYGRVGIANDVVNIAQTSSFSSSEESQPPQSSELSSAGDTPPQETFYTPFSSSEPADTSTTSSIEEVPAPQASSIPAPVSSAPAVQQGMYKDGTYTGPSVDAYYGNVQIQVTVQKGQISDVQFLDYPQDRRTSAFINSQAMPALRSEAIQAQSAPVDIVSGATYTSEAFNQSLASVLSQARNS